MTNEVGKFFKQEVSNVVVGDPVEFKKQDEPVVLQCLVSDLVGVLPDGQVVEAARPGAKAMFWIEIEFPHHGAGYPMITDGKTEFFQVKTKTETKEDDKVVPAGPVGTYRTLPPKTTKILELEIKEFVEKAGV